MRRLKDANTATDKQKDRDADMRRRSKDVNLETQTQRRRLRDTDEKVQAHKHRHRNVDTEIQTYSRIYKTASAAGAHTQIRRYRNANGVSMGDCKIKLPFPMTSSSLIHLIPSIFLVLFHLFPATLYRPARKRPEFDDCEVFDEKYPILHNNNRCDGLITFKQFPMNWGLRQSHETRNKRNPLFIMSLGN